MGKNSKRMQSNAKIIPIKHKKTFYAIVWILSIIWVFAMLSLFGIYCARDFAAMNNNYIYEDNKMKMTNVDIFRGSMCLTAQKLMIYFGFGAILLICWLVYQHVRGGKIGISDGKRFYLAFEVIILFSYSLFSTIYYLFSLGWLFNFENPLAQTDLVMLVITIVTAFILKRDLFTIEDKKIFKLMFEEKIK